jgi:hypothetical protein
MSVTDNLAESAERFDGKLVELTRRRFSDPVVPIWMRVISHGKLLIGCSGKPDESAVLGKYGCISRALD